ncbi:MAG: endonuclease/exonuclease/phosphatase family protein [Chloroflexi bacterium]|nr:endonuclease/exonuclease/phosphatase family protein [Chloroflexota bacterium]
MSDKHFLTVATLNILNDVSSWYVRRQLIVQELRALEPDVIALQEVALPSNNAQWIADQLSGYTVHLCPKTGQKSEHEALAILSRLPTHDQATLALVHQDRVAQCVTIEHRGQRATFTNVHLYFSLLNDVPRVAQVRRLLDWLPHDAPVILCGDFNALPTRKSIQLLRAQFVSAYAAANGNEPEFTFPSPLQRGPGLRHSARSVLLKAVGLAQQRRNAPLRVTVDYIFIDPKIHVHECRIAFHRSDEQNERLYPSDHLGLMAKLELPHA